jgi:hypothetical protein
MLYANKNSGSPRISRVYAEDTLDAQVDDEHSVDKRLLIEHSMQGG